MRIAALTPIALLAVSRGGGDDTASAPTTTPSVRPAGALDAGWHVLTLALRRGDQTVATTATDLVEETAK